MDVNTKDYTKNMSLPYMYVGQSQKEVIYNQSMNLIDNYYSSSRVKHYTVAKIDSDNILGDKILITQSVDIDFSHSDFYDSESGYLKFDLPIKVSIDIIRGLNLLNISSATLSKIKIKIIGFDENNEHTEAEANINNIIQPNQYWSAITSIIIDNDYNGVFYLKLGVRDNLLKVDIGNYIIRLQSDIELVIPDSGIIYANLFFIKKGFSIDGFENMTIRSNLNITEADFFNCQLFRSDNNSKVYCIVT